MLRMVPRQAFDYYTAKLLESVGGNREALSYDKRRGIQYSPNGGGLGVFLLWHTR